MSNVQKLIGDDRNNLEDPTAEEWQFVSEDEDDQVEVAQPSRRNIILISLACDTERAVDSFYYDLFVRW